MLSGFRLKERFVVWDGVIYSDRGTDRARTNDCTHEKEVQSSVSLFLSIVVERAGGAAGTSSTVRICVSLHSNPRDITLCGFMIMIGYRYHSYAFRRPMISFRDHFADVTG